MAVVDVIDLTTSSPSVIVIDDDDDNETQEPTHALSQEMEEKDKDREKRKRKKRRKDERDRRERRRIEDQKHDDSWKHDKYDGDSYTRGNKRKWGDDTNIPRSSTGKRRERSPVPLPLFTIDTACSDVVAGPTPIVPSADADVVAEPAVEPRPTETRLLLPAHVTVSAQESPPLLNDISPLSPTSEASGIDFLDDDRALGAPRYFDNLATNPSPARPRGPCKKCGDDDHELKTCPNMICLTCGARNEHNPRSCPILRFCWNCKAKGHLARDCPRIGNMDRQRLDRPDCERCGSWKHHGTNCPTLWRIYTYLTDAERDAVLADRESKLQLGFDGGGEGYIARDQWCYNCGGSGHFGDDCEATAPNHDRPDDDSAFGAYNQLTGPFASASSVSFNFERRPREWEDGGRFDDDFAGTDVGRKGRENAKAKAREAQRLLDEEDDEPDWFNMNRTVSKNEKAKAKPSFKGKHGLPPKPLPSTIRLGSHQSTSWRAPWDSAPSLSSRPSSRPSLRDRIDTRDGQATNHSSKASGERRTKNTRKESEEKRSRAYGDTQGREWRRDKERRSTGDDHYREHGSRWRGGYDR